MGTIPLTPCRTVSHFIDGPSAGQLRRPDTLLAVERCAAAPLGSRKTPAGWPARAQTPPLDREPGRRALRCADRSCHATHGGPAVRCGWTASVRKPLHAVPRSPADENFSFREGPGVGNWFDGGPNLQPIWIVQWLSDGRKTNIDAQRYVQPDMALLISIDAGFHDMLESRGSSDRARC